MSQNKDENAAMAGGVGLVIGILYCVALAMFVFAAVAAFILTLIAFFAWNKAFTLGDVTVQPEDARAFVWRGVAGAIGLPLTIMIFAAFLDIAVDWDLRPYFMIAGYTIGSLGIEYLIYKQREPSVRAMHAVTPYPPAAQPSQHRGLPAPSSQTKPAHSGHPSHTPATAPFRFVTWDDEDRV